MPAKFGVFVSQAIKGPCHSLRFDFHLRPIIRILPQRCRNNNCDRHDLNLRLRFLLRQSPTGLFSSPRSEDLGLPRSGLRPRYMSKSARHDPDRIATVRPERPDVTARSRLRLVPSPSHGARRAVTPPDESESDCAWIVLRARSRLDRFQTPPCGHI